MDVYEFKSPLQVGAEGQLAKTAKKWNGVLMSVHGKMEIMAVNYPAAMLCLRVQMPTR